MKYLSILLFYIGLFVSSYGQAPDPKKNYNALSFKKYHINKYEERWTSYYPNDSVRSSRLMNMKEYNNEGMITLNWQYAPDMVVSIDSSVYYYDENGKLNSQIRYTRYIDRNIDERPNLLNLIPSPNIDTFKYVYNEVNNLELVLSNRTSAYGTRTSDTTFYEYDNSNNCTLKETHYQKEIFVYESETNNLTSKYLLKKTKVIVPGRPTLIKESKDTIFSNFVYNTLGQIEAVYSNNDTTFYYYDENNLLIKQEKTGLKRGKETKSFIEYSYNQNKELVEEKRYSEDKLFYWKKFEYDENGFLIRETKLNAETGKPELVFDMFLSTDNK